MTCTVFQKLALLSFSGGWFCYIDIFFILRSMIMFVIILLGVTLTTKPQ
jgi:hypothetical protein